MRALIHLVPRAGAGDRFGAQVAAVVAGLRERAAARGIAVNALHRLSADAFGKRTPFRAGIELAGGEGAAIEALLGVDLGAQFEGVAHPDASTLLFGEDVVFVARRPTTVGRRAARRSRAKAGARARVQARSARSEPKASEAGARETGEREGPAKGSPRTPVRYQYLMRRNASFTHETYLEYYRTKHSRFGLVTPGHLGYVQLHVDPVASRRAAGRAGFGIWGCDSVSELHLESQETFLRALAESGFGKEPTLDEEIFVDRANSLDLCSTVDWGT